MQAFWDVLWSDVTALATFALPMLLLALPASALGAAIGAIGYRLESWRQLLRAIARSVIVGSLAAMLLGMLMEYGFRLEGLPDVRRALRDYTVAPLWGAAIAVAFGAGFFAARRHTPGLLGSAPVRSRFMLWQLFAAQLVVGLALGWWAFTRREEIGYRHGELNWHAQLAADKALFGAYGWEVDTWPDYDYYLSGFKEDWINLFPPRPFRPQPVTDETLELVVRDERVYHLVVVSDGVTDAGLARLAASKSLTNVWIQSTQITDDGVAKLCQLRGLNSVGITSAQLTKVSLQRLAEVKSLSSIVLDSPLITPQDEAAFRLARPDLHLRINSASW